MEVSPEHRPVDVLRNGEHVMVIVPVDAEIHEAQEVAEEGPLETQQRADVVVSLGTRNARTMMVIRMAITPSVKASIRSVRIENGSW
jgi:PHD/YefM family antitoxin component YafN of YafNO toxin-antitoxin module